MSRFTKHKTEYVHKQRHTNGVLLFIDSTRLRVLLLAAIALCGGLYLWLVNTSASSGFYLTDLEHQRASLQDEQKRLDVVQAELQTLGYLQEMSGKSGLVQTTAAEYIDELPSSVAVAE